MPDKTILSSVFVDSMDGSLDVVRARWEELAELYDLDTNSVFWMLLNSLVIVAADKETPPATMDVYLRHMGLHRHSLLNLYRDECRIIQKSESVNRSHHETTRMQ